MKRISETLMAMPPTGHPLVEAARDALKLPARNHAPVEGDHWRPACDRFVLPGDWPDVLQRAFGDAESMLAAATNARVPLVPCFVEHDAIALYCHGAVEAPTVTVFVRPSRVDAPLPVCSFVMDHGEGSGFLAPSASIHLEAGAYAFGYCDDQGENKDPAFFGLMKVAVATLAALSSPRVTSVRRVLPSMLDRARAARSRRRAQVGVPLSSYNKVEFVLPKTALHRGQVRPVESFAGLRGHMVVGHWRLIDGVLEPYWLWVDGHCRGNADLGWVSKERRVVRHDDLRRGFLMPERDGHPGERLPAVRGGRRHER